MNSLRFASIKQLRAELAARHISPAEVLAFYTERIRTHDGKLAALLELFDDESVMDIPGGAEDGVLAGIPGVLKDNICQAGRTLTCASKILQGYVAPYNATATTRLKGAGALLLGRANMDEFAMGSSTETSAYAKTKNPWDTSRVPGGSSGGAAAAVAAGLVPWALGSETGGSVRQPAALCGIVGIKPTYGLVSRYGLVAYASSLDQIGVMTRTVYDNALVLSVIAGKDVHDSSTLPVEAYDYTKNLTGKLPTGLRIGIIENALYAQGMDEEIVAAIEQVIKVLEQQGASCVRMLLPTMDYAAATYFIVSRAEAASNLARFDGIRYGMRDTAATTLGQLYANTRHDGFGDEVRRRIMVGNYVLSAGHAGAFYNKAKNVQTLMRQECTEAFKEFHLLLAPTHPAPAFKLGAFDSDRLKLDLQDYFTCLANLAGIPALSLPCGFTRARLPIGFQLMGPHLSEELLYQTAHVYEQATAWHTHYPQGF